MSQVNGNGPSEERASSQQATQEGNSEQAQQQPQSQSSQQQANSSQPQTNLTDPLVAATSQDDSGQGKRPRDARLLHIILSSLGVQAYQERVPLQMMDFAYRYTSGILQDAVHLTSESYGTAAPGNKGAAANDSSSVTLQSLRLAIASRQHYQFQASLPKEHFAEVAAEKNKIALPAVGKNAGLRLPPERYRLTGVGYALRDEWDMEVEVDETSGLVVGSGEARANGAVQSDSQMSGIETGEAEGQGDEVMQDA